MRNDGGTKAARRMINKWAAFKNEVPTLLGNQAVTFFKQSFRNQGFTDSSLGAWQRRKVVDTGRATLVKSGALRNSVRLAYATMAKTSVISDLPYSAIHNYGQYGKAWGKHPFKMPKRKFMGVSHELNKKALLLIRLKLNRVF